MNLSGCKLSITKLKSEICKARFLNCSFRLIIIGIMCYPDSFLSFFKRKELNSIVYTELCSLTWLTYNQAFVILILSID